MSKDINDYRINSQFFNENEKGSIKIEHIRFQEHAYDEMKKIDLCKL